MFRKIIFLIICFIFFANYGSHSLSKNNIYGNWYPFINTRINPDEMNYVEQYFNHNEFYFYHPILSMPYRYFIKKNKMYWLGLLKKDTVIIEKPVFLDKNTLKMFVKKPDYIILKRVIDTNTLDDFVNHRIDEKTYYPSYLKRKEYWEKYGMLPEDGDFENPPKCSD